MPTIKPAVIRKTRPCTQKALRRLSSVTVTIDSKSYQTSTVQATLEAFHHFTSCSSNRRCFNTRTNESEREAYCRLVGSKKSKMFFLRIRMLRTL
ncbi:hypothetical protein RU639_009438 [Aspergillus parasiticus]